MSQESDAGEFEMVGTFADSGPPPAAPTGDLVYATVDQTITVQLVARPSRPFTVLFRDGRTLVYRGHAIREVQPGVFGIVWNACGKESVLAVVRGDGIAGLFDGVLPEPAAGPA